jgi:elongation factor Ts
MEKAVEIILKKGLAKSAKRAGAVATEGEVRAQRVADKRAANIVEVNIQTDFAARNDSSSSSSATSWPSPRSAQERRRSRPAPARGQDRRRRRDRAHRQDRREDRRPPLGRVEVAAGKHGLAHAYNHLGGKIGVVLAIEADSAEARSPRRRREVRRRHGDADRRDEPARSAAARSDDD